MFMVGLNEQSLSKRRDTLNRNLSMSTSNEPLDIHHDDPMGFLGQNEAQLLDLIKDGDIDEASKFIEVSQMITRCRLTIKLG